MGTYLWHILQYSFTLAWPIYGYIMELVAIIIAYIVAKYPKRENVMKGLAWKLPLIVFGVLMVFHVFVLGPYYYDKERQSTIDGQSSRIDELQRQIREMKERTPAGLGFVYFPSQNRITRGTTTQDVVITAIPKFEPPYSSEIPVQINNIDQYYYLFEVVRFRASEGFKFMPLSAELPRYFIIQEGYEYTDTMMVIVKDYPPLASNTLRLKVYTLDNRLEGTEGISEEVLAKGIEKSIK